MTLEFILRIFVAAILGGLIGLEREYRAKEAGFRTHFLVALGAALFMIISAHGFADVLQLDGFFAEPAGYRLHLQGCGFRRNIAVFELFKAFNAIL